MSPIQLLTYDDVAKALQISESQVSVYVSLGELQPVRLGRRVRFRVQDVEAFINKQIEKSAGLR